MMAKLTGLRGEAARSVEGCRQLSEVVMGSCELSNQHVIALKLDFESFVEAKHRLRS